ncbi:MAG: hypothetical protein ACRCUE_15450 [Bosea sp. (in: a-proteobacteria)]
MLRLIPFMIVAVAVYIATVVVAGMPIDTRLIGFGLPSGAQVTITLSDGIILVGIATLFIELMTATSPRATSLINHGLSLCVFIGCGLAFLLVARCGTGTFLVLTFLTLVDVVAGYSIGIITARRDFSLEKQN